MARANPPTSEFPYRYFARKPHATRGQVYSFATESERDYQADKHAERGYHVERFDALPLFSEEGR